MYAKSVDEYLEKSGQWEPILTRIRAVMLSCELEEAIKWGAPAYLYQGKTIIGLGAFKKFATIWFHQGVFLSDPHNKLVNAQEGVTKALRQYRFKTELEFDKKLLKEYVEEAITNQKEGKILKTDRNKTLPSSPQLNDVLEGDTDFKTSFDKLTDGQKREYIKHIIAAKQDKTKVNRIEKIRPLVIQGVGLNDKYK